jgi:transcriptional regulator with AAA-type ATPase domain
LTSLKFEELIIPTNDSERNAYFIKESIENQLNVLLTGPTGTGKTVSAISIVT